MTHFTSAVPFFFLFTSLALLSVATAQGRAPHGLANEAPLALSPSALDFFHPKAGTNDPCAASNCSPLPVAAQVDGTRAYDETKASTSLKQGKGLTAGGIAGIVVASTFVVLAAMGAYYVVITRRTNGNSAKSVLPNA